MPAELKVVNVSPLLRELVVEAIHSGPLDRRDARDGHLVDCILDQLDEIRQAPFQLPQPRDPRARALASRLAESPAASVAELATTVPVIAETSWLILDRLGTRAQAEFVRMVAAARLEALDLTEIDWHRCAELVERYTDLRLDVMDASLVAVAERLGAQTIATMNRRDFAVVRPSHVEAFQLVP